MMGSTLVNLPLVILLGYTHMKDGKALVSIILQLPNGFKSGGVLILRINTFRRVPCMKNRDVQSLLQSMGNFPLSP